MRILAIETSCDETSIALIEMGGSSKKPHLTILSHIISSQVKIHEKFGGVVPNLAAREHQKNLVPILIRALKESGLLKPKFQNLLRQAQNPEQSRGTNSKQIQNSKFKKLKKVLEREPELFARIRERIIPLQTAKIDAIAVTVGPGLEPALWVGINFAKALSLLWDKPIIPVNHMEGHIVSALLTSADTADRRRTNAEKRRKQKKIHYSLQTTHYSLPAIALLVSGGHTELVLVKKIGKYNIIGETLDDAAGEAFDKVARLLGLGYPGGPQIEHFAQFAQKNAEQTQINAEKKLQVTNYPSISSGSRATSRDKLQIKLPRPMLHSDNLNFSFSGLKTAVLYLIRDLENPSIRSTRSGSRSSIEKLKPIIAREFQDAVVEVLVKKTMDAAKRYRTKTILLGGGVAANKLLRKELANKAVLSKTQLLISPLSLTGDNALMIAIAAFFQKKKARKNSLLRALGHLRLT